MSASASVWELSLAAFRDAIESRSTPGCGAAAATSAGFGLALVLKGLRISQSKAQDVRRAALIERADALLGELGRYADDDVQAFDAYVSAMQLPKESVQEQAQRERAIETAAISANRIPLATAETCLAALELVEASLPLTASALRSDTLAGGFLLHSGLSCVLLNVDANLSSLHDTARQEAAAHSRDALRQKAERKLRWLEGQAGSL